MLELYDQIQEAKAALQRRWDGKPRVGIILGTGLGGLAEDIQTEAAVAYGDIPHFPQPTVKYHAGRLVCGQLGGKSVMAMEGRRYDARMLAQPEDVAALVTAALVLPRTAEVTELVVRPMRKLT